MVFRAHLSLYRDVPLGLPGLLAASCDRCRALRVRCMPLAVPAGLAGDAGKLRELEARRPSPAERGLQATSEA